MNAFDVIPHLRNTAEATHPLLIALQFVANADGALGLGKDEREWLEIGWFLLYQRSLREGDPESVPSGHFAVVAERQHETGGVDPPLDNILRGDAGNTRTEELGQLCPFRDLVFNHWLDILLFLLASILPLDIFCRATAEVVGPVLFRDDVWTPGPGAADLCGKAPSERQELAFSSATDTSDRPL
jgi:hypothetical protein